MSWIFGCLKKVGNFRDLGGNVPKTEISWFQISHLMNLYLKLKKAGIKKRKFIVCVSGEHEVDVECETRATRDLSRRSCLAFHVRFLFSLKNKKTKQNKTKYERSLSCLITFFFFLQTSLSTARNLRRGGNTTEKAFEWFRKLLWPA